MAIGDILSLKKPMGTKLICVLYGIAMVLIALGTLQGVVRGARMMMGPPAIAALAGPENAAAVPPGPDTANPAWQRGRPFRGDPAFGGPFRRHAPMLFGWMLPPPVAGLLRIIFSLVRGLVVLLVVRVLAEIGNTILALRTDGSRAL